MGVLTKRQGTLNFLKAFVLFASLYSIFNFLLDYLVDYSAAIKEHGNYIFGYFIYFLIYRGLIVLILMVTYTKVFSRKMKNELIFKVLFVLSVSLILAWAVQGDLAVSLRLEAVKRFISYPLTAIVTLVIVEASRIRYKNR